MNTSEDIGFEPFLWPKPLQFSYTQDLQEPKEDRKKRAKRRLHEELNEMKREGERYQCLGDEGVLKGGLLIQL